MVSKVANIDLFGFVSIATKRYINSELKLMLVCSIHSSTMWKKSKHVKTWKILVFDMKRR